MPTQKSKTVTYKPVSASSLNLIGAMTDIFSGIAKFRIWNALAWQEFSSTYRRSIFGVLWVTLSFALFVFIKLIIFSSLLLTDNPGYYDSYLVLGFFIWYYMSTVVSAAPDTFMSNKGWIRSESLPFSVYVYKSVLKESYSLGFTLVVVAAAFVYIGYDVNYGALPDAMLAIPFYFLHAVSIKLFLGTISVKLRDISHFVKAIILPMLFLTPIFWMPEQMGDLMTYLWWNPFYHYIEIFRGPILTGEFPTESWIFLGVMYAILTPVALLIFGRFRRRIVFWL